MKSETQSDEPNDEATCSSEPPSDLVWRSLPEELLHQVLQRIPIESVMKFRCVCRGWNQLLMSSTFSGCFHHKPGKLTPLYLDSDERTVTLYSTTTQRWLSHSLQSSLAQVPFLEHQDKNFVDLVASAGGLLSFMVSGVTELDFLIYNPLTEMSLRLQPIQELEIRDPSGDLILSPDTVMSKVVLYGIHVDFETGYYSFVVVDTGSLTHESTTLIYDSGLHSWKLGRAVPRSIIQLYSSINPLLPNVEKGCKSQCVTSEGKLYWMVEHQDGSDSVFIYDIKLDRWSYVKCFIPHERVVLVRLLEHENEVLLVGRHCGRMTLSRFCYFVIVELSGSSSTALSTSQSFPAPSFVGEEYREMHLQERVMPFESVMRTLDESRRSDARPSWCVGGCKEVYFLLESTRLESTRLEAGLAAGRRPVRFTSPMVRYSSVDASGTWLTNWKIRDEGSGFLKPDASNQVWAFQPSLVHP